MDPATITALLAPCLPFLLDKVGGSALESAAAKLGEDTWNKAKAIWAKLRPQAESNAAVKVATEKLAEKPNSATWKAALEEELQTILEQDSDLAAAIAEILGEDATGSGIQNTIQQTVQENKGQVIGQMNDSEAKSIGQIIVIYTQVFQKISNNRIFID